MSNCYDYVGDVVLPDGNSVYGHLKGYLERDTNGWVTTDLEICWANGEPLTEAEENRRVDDGHYLHEWVEEQLLKLEPELPDDEP